MTNIILGAVNGAAAIAACLVSTQALAGGTPPVPVSQSRSLMADTFVIASPVSNQDFQTASWPAVGAFDTALDAHAELPQGNAVHHTEQTTEIAPFGMQGIGSASATANVLAPNTVAYSIGSSDCSMTFDVATASPYRIIGMLVAGPNSQSSAKLVGPLGTLIEIVVVGDSQPVQATGTLSPGRYTFLCSTFASATTSVMGASADSASFSLHFSTSAEPADLDNDGGIGPDDLGMLLGAWGPCEACAADLDWNGIVDGADLAGLLAGWTG